MMDVLVFGATGFTGQIAANYMASKTDLSWGVAGRSEAKLTALVQKLTFNGSVPEVLVCDLEDAASLKAAFSKTKVVLSTAGPYEMYGEAVIEACIEAGTDYVDLTGEVVWVKRMMEKYHEQACSKNVILSSMCGFDSVPSDLGTLFTVQKMRERFGLNTQVKSITNYAVAFTTGGLSGGSLSSFKLMSKQPGFHDPFLLGGKPKDGSIREVDLPLNTVEFDEKIGSYIAPFVMQHMNPKVVRASAAVLSYGKNFNYREVALAPSKEVAIKLQKMSDLSKSKAVNAVGEGPSKEHREQSFFEMTFRAESEKGEVIFCRVSGGDPGYEEAAKFACESALCLAEQKPLLRVNGGYFTPAVAFGTHLIDRLIKHGIQFTQVMQPIKL